MVTVREFYQAMVDEQKNFLVEERQQVCRLAKLSLQSVDKKFHVVRPLPFTQESSVAIFVNYIASYVRHADGIARQLTITT